MSYWFETFFKGSGDCTAEIVEVGISEEELAENYAAKACEDNQG